MANQKLKVLLLENINPKAKELFTKSGYQVEAITTPLLEKELLKKISQVSILGVRSKTQVNKKLIKAAKSLIAIGVFCIGTNNIDHQAAKKNKITVFNSPYANTTSVVELTIGLIIMLLRNVFQASKLLHQGTWLKSLKGSHEIKGKTLGIIGYGNIGTQLSFLAQALGMKVVFYDVINRPAFANAKKLNSLKKLLQVSDVVSIHVDAKKTNKTLIGKKELALMKPESFLLNLSRGQVVDLKALEKALRQKKIAGAAIDVFSNEPKQNKAQFKSPLAKLNNVILTPHIGANTQEAHKANAQYLANKLISFLKNKKASKDQKLSKNWIISNNKLYSVFKVKNFNAAIKLINKISSLAKKQNHHPNLSLENNKLTLELYTHKTNELTEHDFLLAKKLDKLIKSHE